MKLKLIVLIITLFTVSCTNTDYTISKISYEDNIKVQDSVGDIEIELIIKPFRNKIKTLEKTVGFSEESYSIRDGKLESTLGNLIADILYEESNPEFYKMTSKNIDFALSLEPDNQMLINRKHHVSLQRENNQPSLPSTIQLELDTNPFLRSQQPTIVQKVDSNHSDELSVFTKIRFLRNHY